jgi:hypothetical protein
MQTNKARSKLNREKLETRRLRRDRIPRDIVFGGAIGRRREGIDQLQRVVHFNHFNKDTAVSQIAADDLVGLRLSKKSRGFAFPFCPLRRHFAADCRLRVCRRRCQHNQEHPPRFHKLPFVRFSLEQSRTGSFFCQTASSRASLQSRFLAVVLHTTPRAQNRVARAAASRRDSEPRAFRNFRTIVHRKPTNWHCACCF